MEAKWGTWTSVSTWTSISTGLLLPTTLPGVPRDVRVPLLGLILGEGREGVTFLVLLLGHSSTPVETHGDLPPMSGARGQQACVHGWGL